MGATGGASNKMANRLLQTGPAVAVAAPLPRNEQSREGEG